MSLQKLNNVYVDLNKIAYVGFPDTHVKSHIGVTLHYFLTVVDGHPIEFSCDTKEELLKLRQTLIDKLTITEGLLPG